MPGLAITVRRLHDIGKSGWTIFITLIPIAGSIWMLVLLLTKGNDSFNEFGEKPSEIVIDEEKRINSNDKLLLIVIIWVLFSGVIWFVLGRIINDFFLTKAYDIINVISYKLWLLVPLILTFIIKNKSKRFLLMYL